MKKLLFLLCWSLVVSLLAQDDPTPGRIFISNSVPDEVGDSIAPLFQPAVTPGPQSLPIAETNTPDIQALAGNLGNNPTNIFNFVHDQIRYVPYFGSLKGAELTLLERSGNDFDQCALLSALLRAAGYSTGYQFGYMMIPYDGTNGQDLHHWLCLNLQNTNFGNTFLYFKDMLGTRGYGAPVQTFNDTNTLAFQRVWVTLTLDGTDYYLDPSFKVSEPVSGVSLASAMGFNSNTLWSAAGGTDTNSSVSGLSEASLRSALQTCNSNLLAYLTNNVTNATVSQVVGGEQIVSSVGSPLSTSLLFPLYTNGIYPMLSWTNEPTNFMSTFSLSFAGTNQTWFTPALAGQRIALVFTTNGTGQLWQEDSMLLQTTNTGKAQTLSVITSAQHPYGGWDTNLNVPIDTGIYDRGSTNSFQRTNASYNIMYGFDPSPQWLQERQQKLDAYRLQGYADTSRQVTTETLNVMGLSWLVQTELALELLAQEGGQLPHHHHRFGRMAQEQSHGYYVDAYLQLDSTLPSTGYNAPDIAAQNQVFDVTSYLWSAMEHGMIEQLQDSNLLAASTVKMIQIANTNLQAVYLASNGNWASVAGSLVKYGTNMVTFTNLINEGFVLLLPKSATNHVTVSGTSWSGFGYMELGNFGNARVMGSIIQGGYNGGFSPNPTDVINSPVVQANGDGQANFFDPQSVTLQISALTGADPVNLADGSFQISSSDLSLGQTELRGLNLSRYYSSARRNSNPAGMAPGWLHNYYCVAQAVSDPEGGLGSATVQEMAPMIVTTCAALNFYNNINLDPKNWTMTALIAKWGIDQLVNNSVSVSLGKDTLQFVKQSDGSFTPQANCTMSLLQTNGDFWLQERHGRTFQFGTAGMLTNIVDQYGQAMRFAYNSNNLVTNIVDWKGRSLVFKYAGGTVLTNVSDNTGRSISYGYTGGQLTSYTDPEGKTNGYAYDTNNEVLATYDALGRLVVTNNYDGFGHVTTQLTQGDTNKTWQIFASGYQTVEIDPAGDESVYTYDSKSRLIAVQDGMGDLTQTVYDGQDHVVQTISPLGETNQYVYDDNNNLVETIDPLGFSNVFTFDTNNNLIAATDANRNTSHFGYNAQFSLTGSTNGNGDFTVLGYNTDGTLASRQDSAGSTSYTYDGNGQLNSITYPGSLRSESFVNSTLGDPTSHTDARGFTTTFAYNKRRQLTNTVAPTNLTASVSFDANANVSTTTDARGFVTSNSWSVTRHLLSMTLPTTPQGAPVITSAYDARDWLASVQNPLGNVTYYTNDAAQRLVATTDPMQRTSTVGYDQDSRPTSTTDAAGDQTAQSWNARGNLVRVIDAATNIVGKAYDGAGNLSYLTNRDGNVWRFQYDGANRLTNTISPLSYVRVFV